MIFMERAVDAPTSMRCPHCQASVPLPDSEPWLVDGLRWLPPTLESFLCPSCYGRIYLVDVTDEERARDAEWDSIREQTSCRNSLKLN